MTLVVRRRRPFLLVGTVLLAGAIAAVAVWWSLGAERRQLDAQTVDLRAERDTLLRARAVLEARNEELSRRVAVLERSRQVESAAYAQVDQQLAALQDQVLALKEEVAFFKSIVGDDDAGTRVRIQRFQVERDGTPQDYRFRLVLTRGIRSDKVATGVVTLAVDGDRDGERERLGFEQLTPFPVGRLEYSFKHFQRLEGRLRLPPRFVPRRVIVRVDAEKNGTKPLRETYPWPSVKS